MQTWRVAGRSLPLHMRYPLRKSSAPPRPLKQSNCAKDQHRSQPPVESPANATSPCPLVVCTLGRRRARLDEGAAPSIDAERLDRAQPGARAVLHGRAKGAACSLGVPCGERSVPGLEREIVGPLDITRELDCCHRACASLRVKTAGLQRRDAAARDKYLGSAEAGVGASVVRPFPVGRLQARVAAQHWRGSDRAPPGRIVPPCGGKYVPRGCTSARTRPARKATAPHQPGPQHHASRASHGPPHALRVGRARTMPLMATQCDPSQP